MSRRNLNAYWCKVCGHYIVTVDLDEGVTPMFLACRVQGEPNDPANTCTGTMQSMMYPPHPWPKTDGFGVAIPTEPTWEWYKPDERELARMRRKDPAGYEHVRKGGLLLRKRT
jgi:hypothetical protein